MDLIIARHGESVDWLAQVPGEWNIRVMNSGLPIIPTTRAFEQVGVPDAGVESGAYLNHIIFNYDKLADFTLFIQGNPFDHAAAATDPGVAPNFIERLKQLPALMSNPAVWFLPIGNWNECGIDEPMPFKQARMFPLSKRLIYNMRIGVGTLGEEVLTPLYPIRDYLGYLLRPIENLPPKLGWPWGNQFAVRREAIHNFHPDFWKRFYDTLEHAPKPLEGTIAERIWLAIFQEGYKRANRAVS